MSFEGSREGQTWRGVVKLEHLAVGIVEDLVTGEKLVLRERLFAEARVMVKLS